MLLICPRNTIKISQKLSNNKYTTSRPSNAHSVVTTVHRRMRSLRVLCTATNQLQQNFEKVTNLPCKVGISVYTPYKVCPIAVITNHILEFI